MKSLSAANDINIAAAFQPPAILVEMPGLSEQWASRTTAGYDTSLVSVSEITQAVDPLGGLAEQADFSVVIQQESPAQFFTHQKLDNETVNVYLKYGADDKITLIKGRLDRWEFSAGLLTLHCIANLDLWGKQLPRTQITAANFPSFVVPEDSVGRWVPITFGSHNRARGILIDQFIDSGVTDGRKVKYNETVAGHDAIKALINGLVWASPIKEYLIVQSLNGDFTLRAGGHCVIERGAGDTNESVGLVEIQLTVLPKIATTDGDADMDNPAYAIDEDFETYAEADNIGVATTTTYLRARIPDLPFPRNVVLSRFNGSGSVPTLALLIQVLRDPAINAGARTSETLDTAIELAAGTFPASGLLIEDVLADGETERDNLNEETDPKDDIQFTVSQYRAVIGEDTDNDSTKDELPLSALGGRNITVRYTEEDLIATNENLKIYELRLRIAAVMDSLNAEFFADLDGFEDDGGGTYTGVASALIENPADVIYFTLAELLELTDITTASVASARSALGNTALAGQVLEPTEATTLLDKLAREGKLKLYIDLDDQWAVRAYTIPGTADRELIQASGDFITSDGLMEGEIVSITQSPLDQLYNQFELLYAWSDARGAYDGVLTLDETTEGPVGDWLTESQADYNVTRKLTVALDWIRTEAQALSYGIYLIYMLADRKLEAQWQTSFNAVDLEIGDRIRLTHTDVQACERTVVHAGYRAGDPLATIKAGYTDPDTAATVKAGAYLELHEGRHQYEINTIETVPMEGRIVFTGRQVDFSRSPLSDPLG